MPLYPIDNPTGDDFEDADWLDPEAESPASGSIFDPLNDDPYPELGRDIPRD